MSHVEALERIIQLLEQKVMNLELDLVNERLKKTQAPSEVIIDNKTNGTFNIPYYQFISGGIIQANPQYPYYGTISIQGTGGTTSAQTCESQGAHAIHNQTSQFYGNQNLGLVPEHERNRG